jgi:oligopeptidase B
MSKGETLRPPVARKVPKRLKLHDDVRMDDYHWMRDRANPGVIEYIEAENRYALDFMKHTESLQRSLFEELKSRTNETDSSVPERIDDYYYYTRTEAGKQYPIHCRKKGSLDGDEEIILDENRVANGNVFFKVCLVKVSPDHNMVLYLADKNGSEKYTLFVKDLRTGNLLKDQMVETSDAEWANDNKTIFYSVMDVEYRPYKVFRHVLGTDPKHDVEVIHERDAGYYYMELAKTRSRDYILITVESATTSEVHYVRADRPTDPFMLIRPRKHGMTYFAVHHDNQFFIVTNEDAINFKIMEAPTLDPTAKNWKELVPHRKTVAIDVSDPHPWVEAFEDHLVVFERERAQGRIRVYDMKDMSSHLIEFPESIYFVMPIKTSDPKSNKLRLKYWSLVTPTRVYDYDLRTRTLELMKQEEISGYDSSDYVQEMVFATSKDGTKIPITLVHRKGLKTDGKNPAYLYGYGAYGTFEWASSGFNTKLVSLLSRGFVCASAHIRGGGEMGRGWHHDGRMLKKRNSLTDFIACAEHLIAEGYTSSDRLVIRGRSAGGLLMGAVTNLRPDLFKVVVAEVPFVDGVTTMLDPTIPMTVGEFEEWGNPTIKEHYDYIKGYSPYDNVMAKDYPNMLITSSLNDSRVPYWEPVKWAAKLRALKTDDNIVLMRTGIVEGHAGASGRYDYARWFAFMYAFILDRFGMNE